jgi:hypothetical protein
MSETRRELFKTSVLSAVGVASIGLLSGCQTWGHGPPGLTGPVPAVGKADNSTQWYVFITASGTTTVYAAGFAPCSLTPSTCPFDTASYVQQLSAAGQLSLAKGLTVTIGQNSYSTDGNGILLNPSFNPAPKTFSWNEIGSA